MASLYTKRWNDTPELADGTRILVCRYRPRGLPKAEETWTEWLPQLGPSRTLHAEAYGKYGPPITWAAFTARYLDELVEQRDHVAALGARLEQDETITLLCSSACVDAGRCHRILLRRAILDLRGIARA